MALFEMAKGRMEALGFEIQEHDHLFAFCVSKVTQSIKNECNTSRSPESLLYVAADRVCGEYLLARKTMGKLEGIDLSLVAKEISEGDTKVGFAVGDGNMTPEQRLDTLIGHLLHAGEDEIISKRRFRW